MKNKCGYSKKDLQYIRNFVKEINNEIIVKIASNENFYCKLPIYKLYLGNKKMPSYQKEVWEEWYKKQSFYCGEVNYRIVSLLHEIGHFETFDVNEWISRNNEVNHLEYQFWCGEINGKELNFAYWDLPNEYKATEWAIKYYQENKEKCDKLAKVINYK